MKVQDVCRLVRETLPGFECVMRTDKDMYHFTILDPKKIASTEVGVNKFGCRDRDMDIAASAAYSWACAYVFTGVKFDNPETFLVKAS
jgi:hypothetical protein